MGPMKITEPLQIKVSAKKLADFSEQCQIVLLSKEECARLKKQKEDTLSGWSRSLSGLNDFEGEAAQITVLYEESHARVVVGLGSEKELSPAALRDAASQAIRKCRALKIGEIKTTLWSSAKTKGTAFISAQLEGYILGFYHFSYKSKKPGDPQQTELTLCQAAKNLQKLVQQAYALCNGVMLTRDLVNQNASDITPQVLASEATRVAKAHRLKINILDEKAILKEGMGLLGAVGQGAVNPPRLICLEYRGSRKGKTLAIVGKGITFDTGGLNLKPSGHIEDMRLDMAGAATVLGAMQAIAALKLKVNVIGVMTCAENAISAEAYKPGDVFTAYNGKTVQVLNTDAEGRLALADALSYVEDKYQPDTIVDLATLTGACLVALGTHYAALLSANERLVKKIRDASAQTDEKVWPLPLTKPFMKDMEGDVSDLRNIGKKRYGGTIQGAVFLSHFIEKSKWAHLDIAGTAWSEEKGNFTPQYATGFGVRLLTTLCQSF